MVPRRAGRDGGVPLDGDGLVASLIGSRLITRRGSVRGAGAFCEPGRDNGFAAAQRLVVGVVAVADVCGEQLGDSFGVIRLPRLDIAPEPAIDVIFLQGGTFLTSRGTDRFRGMLETYLTGGASDRGGV